MYDCVQILNKICTEKNDNDILKALLEIHQNSITMLPTRFSLFTNKKNCRLCLDICMYHCDMSRNMYQCSRWAVAPSNNTDYWLLILATCWLPIPAGTQIWNSLLSTTLSRLPPHCFHMKIFSFLFVIQLFGFA